MQLSWWVLPLFFIPPRLSTPQWTLSTLALAPWSPQCHKTALTMPDYWNIAQTLWPYRWHHCGAIGVTMPQVAILKLEQYRPISILVSSYLSSHVRTRPTCHPSWVPQGPQAWCPNWSVETSHIWLADNWAVWGFLSLLQTMEAGNAFKEWRKSPMMVPGLSTWLTSLAATGNGNMSSGNPRVPLKLTCKNKKKSAAAFLEYLSSTMDHPMSQCAGSINWRMSITSRWNPWWAW